LSFRQFIRTKRARFGIKIYQLCTSSGVLLDFLIYHGNSAAELIQLPDFLTTEKIPITLLQPYLNNGHILFTDNFYTTPRLTQSVKNDVFVNFMFHHLCQYGGWVCCSNERVNGATVVGWY